MGSSVTGSVGIRSSSDWRKTPTLLAKATATASCAFEYPTKFIEWNPSKRVPGVHECGVALGEFLDSQPECDQLFLVGHSMGGLVIQSFLAQKIRSQRGMDLAKIRSVVLFATPNHGATILSNLRGIFSAFRKNPQEEHLRALDKDAAEISDVITRSILNAKRVDNGCCPISFRVFWGLQDNVVPEASARGSFVEASPLPGGTQRNHTMRSGRPAIPSPKGRTAQSRRASFDLRNRPV